MQAGQQLTSTTPPGGDLRLDLASLMPCSGHFVTEQRKELSAHGLAGGNWRHSGQRRLIAVTFHVVAKGIDHCRPARAVGAVLEAAVNHQRMMERAFSGLEIDRRGMHERLPLRET